MTDPWGGVRRMTKAKAYRKIARAVVFLVVSPILMPLLILAGWIRLLFVEVLPDVPGWYRWHLQVIREHLGWLKEQRANLHE